MVVPSTSPGGTNQHYRDNRVDHMLRNTQEYGDTHTFAIVFGAGGTFQTTVDTDGGQFARLLGQYLARGGGRAAIAPAVGACKIARPPAHHHGQ